MKKKETERAALNPTEVDVSVGLNAEQIAERLEKGYVNEVKIGTSRTVGNILFENIFTFFNIVCFIIFIWMITVCRSFEDVKNCTFIVVIALNTLIGVIQEIKAKKTMDKMSLIHSPDVAVLREGEEKAVKMNELLLGDVILLNPGKQICSDAVLRQGVLEVNESQLTGESLPIKKEVGDTVLSGSFVVTGRGRAEVIHIGEDNYLTSLAKEAKKFKKSKSELIRSLMFIMKVISIIIIPVGIIAFLNNYTANLASMFGLDGRIIDVLKASGALSGAERFEAYRASVFPTSTSFIGMIPAGMFLLTSAALAIGIIRLYRKKALVQELYSIETLARVNMLCLDKTGTITDGTMKVGNVFAVKEGITKKDIKEIVSSMQFALNEDNQTASALKQHFGTEEIRKASYVIPFSSERKVSAAHIDGVLYVLGAPEYATDKMSQKVQALVGKYEKQGYRCLLLTEYRYKLKNEKEIPLNTTAIGVIVIEDNIKADCFETIKYFKENDVDVRVISGDNPVTVSVIAKKVGIRNADKYVSLKDLSDEEVVKLAMDYTVFGRVSPSQKKLLIETFKKAGNTVAMTGDGINDILAMKEADCAVAMANGSEATRNVAHVVLLDNNFGSMPSIVGEGRRVINNIERSSTMFLTKTMFTLLLTLILIFAHRPFPIEPVQLSFISMFAIGLPSVVIALEPNNKRIKGSFLRNVLVKITPGAIATVLASVIVVVLGETGNLVMGEKELKTLVTIVILFVFLLVLANICKPFNKYRTIMFASIFVCSLLIIVVSPYLGQITFGGLFKVGTLNLYKLYPSYTLVNIALIVALLYLSEKVIKVTTFGVEKFDAFLFRKSDLKRRKNSKTDEIEENIFADSSVAVSDISEVADISDAAAPESDAEQSEECVLKPAEISSCDTANETVDTVAETAEGAQTDSEAIKTKKRIGFSKRSRKTK